MLEVRDLDVRYGGIHAIRGVSLRIPTGQVVALVGRNGAGKSSLLRAVGGVLRPAGGQVRLNLWQRDFYEAPAGSDPAKSYPGMKPKEAGFDLFQGNMNGAAADFKNAAAPDAVTQFSA